MGEVVRAFVADWRAMWAMYGDAPEGHATFAALIAGLDRRLDELPSFSLVNGTTAAEAIRQHLLGPRCNSAV